MLELTGKSLEEQTIPASFRVVIERASAPKSQTPDAGWVLSLTVQRDQKTLSRRIEGEDCTSVTRAAATALALILEPSTEEESAPSEAPRNTEASPPAESAAATDETKRAPVAEASTKPKPAAPEPSPERDGAWSWGARLGGGVDATLFSEPTGLVQGALHGARGGLRFELAGTFLPPSQHTFTAGTVNLSLIAGALRVCRDTSSGDWVFLPCLAFEAGRLEASGKSGVSQSSALWLAAGASFLGGYELSRDYALLLEVPVQVPLERHQVRVGGTTVVHELPLVDARAILGFEATWP